MPRSAVAPADLDRTIPFVDAHHHLWELGRLDYPWLIEPGFAGQPDLLGDYKAIRVDWGPRRLLREFYGQRVTATVHVEAGCAPDQAVAETAWLDSVAIEYRMPNALVVFCDLTRSDADRALAAHLEASRLTRGVRSRPAKPEDGAFRRGFRAAARLGLSYEYSASPGALMAGLDLARLEPEAQIIVGHAGLPLRRDDAYRALWQREMRALAEAPNVAAKISGLGMADHEWTVESIRPWVIGTIEAFGVDRCMLGSNWPVDSLYSPYFELIDAYRQSLVEAGLSADEQAAILHRNAERIYRVDARPVARAGVMPSARDE